MASVIETPTTSAAHPSWTVVDLADRFGAIPVARISLDPPPGTATVDDAVRISETEHRLVELYDGVLVEKVLGAFESYFASRLITLINNYLAGRGVGTVLGEGGMMTLFPQNVRIPDVSFITFERLRSARFEEEGATAMSPDLAVEVLSPGNTPKEMDRKLRDYFASGTRLVWYIDPRKQEVRVCTAVDEVTTLRESDTLDGSHVLPGFSFSLAEFFDRPWDKKE